MSGHEDKPEACNPVKLACTCGRHCAHGLTREQCHACARVSYPDPAVLLSVARVLRART